MSHISEITHTFHGVKRKTQHGTGYYEDEERRKKEKFAPLIKLILIEMIKKSRETIKCTVIFQKYHVL